MTADTLTITAFLEQRIAEDEAVARAAYGGAESGGQWWVDGPAEVSRKFWIYATGEKFKHESTAQHIARHDPARVLADCVAKRTIVESCRVDYEDSLTSGDDTMALATEVLMGLASIWADHADYRAEWAL